MAASAVAGVAKSIGSAVVTEFKYLYGVEEHIQALQKDLERMLELLIQVDSHPDLLIQDGQLCISTHNLRELAFRAEDAIDTYLVDLKSKIQRENFIKKFVCLASHSYPTHMLIKEIEAIQHGIESEMSKVEQYKNIISTTCPPQGIEVGSSSSKPPSEVYIHLENEFVVGIEDDITKLVERLTDPKDHFKVLGIFGTGGAGKTTLTSKIYHHEKVKKYFPIRAYVSVSQQWNKLGLLRSIFKEVLGDFQISLDERGLVKRLHDHLMKKQCLVVLDDIWKEDVWDAIYPILPHTTGIRVILTTQVKEVLLYADNKCVLHEPKLLTDDQMWSLFSKGAVEGRHGIENNVEFTKLGKVMLQKCHGLPLAVVALVGILRKKEYIYQWKDINVACLGNILVGKGGNTYGVVKKMLQLSYLDLPSHLKPLFLYLSIIPEDEIFKCEELIHMWIAERFITDDQQIRCESLEGEAMRFLEELAQRCIFKVVSRDYQNKIECIRLHDLMRELCIEKARECQFFETIATTCSNGGNRSKSRRISIFPRDYSFEEDHHTRSIFYGSSSSWVSILSDRGRIQNLWAIHIQFKLLRVLSIKTCRNEWLPKEVGNLVHLTYFSLTYCHIYKLPRSIRKLHNLIYFEFSQSFENSVSKVPDGLVEKMENLRVLILPYVLKRGSSKYNNRLGLSSERHKKMHTLKCGAGRWMTKEKMNFPTTIKDLRLSNIEETTEMDALHGLLCFLKDSLHSFECLIGREAKNPIAFDVEKLKEHTSLQVATLTCPLLLSVESIIQFPPNLVSITLCNSKFKEGVDLMKALGLLSELKYLTIVGDFYMGTQLNCASTAFPKLQELQISFLENIQEWRLEERAMGCLEKLTISYCGELKRLPERIRSITTLKHLGIYEMPNEFCKRLGHAEDGESRNTVGFGEDAYIIQHIPTVIFGAAL